MLCPRRGTDCRPTALRRRASRPQLKRDPLGRGTVLDAMQQGQMVLVIGGTRGTGLLIVESLARDGYRVRALARNPGQAAPRLGSAAEVVPGDVTKPETLAAAVKDVTHIIFTAGVAVGPAREKLIVANGVRRRPQHLGIRSTRGLQRPLPLHDLHWHRPTLSQRRVPQPRQGEHAALAAARRRRHSRQRRRLYDHSSRFPPEHRRWETSHRRESRSAPSVPQIQNRSCRCGGNVHRGP